MLRRGNARGSALGRPFTEGRQFGDDPRRETAKLGPRQAHQFVDCQNLHCFRLQPCSDERCDMAERRTGLVRWGYVTLRRAMPRRYLRQDRLVDPLCHQISGLGTFRASIP
jgi:hypothetical protein